MYEQMITIYSENYIEYIFYIRICKPLAGFPYHKKVQVGKDQEKAQSEKDSHSKNRGGKKPN